MKDREKLERWLREAAQDPDLRRLRDQIDSTARLPRDLLARYHAGMLSAEEEAMVKTEIALGKQNLQALAEIEEDTEAAANEVLPPKRSRLLLFRRKPADSPTTSAFGRGWAYAAAAAMIALIASTTLIDGPPGSFDTPYFSSLLERPRGAPESAAEK